MVNKGGFPVVVATWNVNNATAKAGMSYSWVKVRWMPLKRDVL